MKDKDKTKEQLIEEFVKLLCGLHCGIFYLRI